MHDGRNEWVGEQRGEGPLSKRTERKVDVSVEVLYSKYKSVAKMSSSGWGEKEGSRNEVKVDGTNETNETARFG